MADERLDFGELDERLDPWEDEEAEFLELVDACGLLPKELGGGCQLAGTEYCDFDCPFRENPGLLYGDDTEDDDDDDA